MFVCTGNICRSPTAERLALEYGARRRIGGLTASSAGTRALAGYPIHPKAASVLQRLGGDGSSFSARQLTARVLTPVDLVLTMTRAHRESVLELAPSKLHRTFTLAEASRLATTFDVQTVADLSPLRSQLVSDDQMDIPDPMGKGDDVFEYVATLIADLLPPVMTLCARSSGL